MRTAIVSISPHASSNPEDGHFYWMYRGLWQSSDRMGVTIGPARANGAHIIGRISDDARKKKFRVTPLFWWRDGWSKVNQEIAALVQKELKNYQIYDGGLAELIFAGRMSHQHRDATFLYNFHWALDWLALVESPLLRGQLVRKAIQFFLSNKPENLVLTAESKKLASYLEDCVSGEFVAYPIFSHWVSDIDAPQWSERETDALFLPSSFSTREIEVSIESCKILAQAGFNTKIGVATKVWSRYQEAHSPGKAGSLANPRTPVIAMPISENEYRALLSDSKIVVLPYTDPYFKWGSSGKFNEALVCGALPLVPRLTAIASQSTFPDELHILDEVAPEPISRKVRELLAIGNPGGLSGKIADDLVDLFPEQERPTARIRARSRLGILFLWFAAALFKPRGHMEERAPLSQSN